MALPFLNGFNRKTDEIVLVDLGVKLTKAVHISRRGGGYSLHSYTIQETPLFEKGLNVEDVAEHLKKVIQSMESKCRFVGLAIGVGDSLLRHADMPAVPVHDMRTMLRYSSKNYLQQDLSDCVFDCHMLPFRAKEGDEGKPGSKARVLVGAAKKALVDDLAAAAKKAGYVPLQVVPGFIGPPNAFELARPEEFAQESVALVEIGHKNTTITVLYEGELALSRVVSFGSERLTIGLADAMGISEEEAEGAKITMPPEVEAYLVALLSPLGRELRASIDFFDHQHDKSVSRAFFSGGAACNAKIVEALQTEMMVPCETWNPTSFLATKLPPQQIGEVEQIAPQLGVAIGAAISVF